MAHAGGGWRKRPTSSARADRASRSYPFHSRIAMPTTASCKSRAAWSASASPRGKPSGDLSLRRLSLHRPERALWTALSFASCWIAASTLSSREIRAAHSRRVAELAASLCVREGIDPDRGRAAALAHDMCKEMPKKAQRELAALIPGCRSRLGGSWPTKSFTAPRRPPSSRATMASRRGDPGGGSPAYRGQARYGQARRDTLLLGQTRAGARAPRRRVSPSMPETALEGMLLAVVEGVVVWLQDQGRAVAPETLILYSTLVREADPQ